MPVAHFFGLVCWGVNGRAHMMSSTSYLGDSVGTFNLGWFVLFTSRPPFTGLCFPLLACLFSSVVRLVLGFRADVLLTYPFSLAFLGLSSCIIAILVREWGVLPWGPAMVVVVGALVARARRSSRVYRTLLRGVLGCRVCLVHARSRRLLRLLHHQGLRSRRLHRLLHQQGLRSSRLVRTLRHQGLRSRRLLQLLRHQGLRSLQVRCGAPSEKSLMRVGTLGR